MRAREHLSRLRTVTYIQQNDRGGPPQPSLRPTYERVTPRRRRGVRGEEPMNEKTGMNREGIARIARLRCPHHLTRARSHEGEIARERDRTRSHGLHEQRSVWSAMREPGFVVDPGRADPSPREGRRGKARAAAKTTAFARQRSTRGAPRTSASATTDVPRGAGRAHTASRSGLEA